LLVFFHISLLPPSLHLCRVLLRSGFLFLFILVYNSNSSSTAVPCCCCSFELFFFFLSILFKLSQTKSPHLRCSPTLVAYPACPACMSIGSIQSIPVQFSESMSLFFRQDSSNSPNEVFLDDLQSVIAMVLSLIIVSLLSLSFVCDLDNG
jgi:hypothetical protein